MAGFDFSNKIFQSGCSAAGIAREQDIRSHVSKDLSNIVIACFLRSLPAALHSNNPIVCGFSRQLHPDQVIAAVSPTRFTIDPAANIAVTGRQVKKGPISVNWYIGYTYVNFILNKYLFG
jgi:hypothetical protein